MLLVQLTYFSRNRLDLFNGPMTDRISDIVAVSNDNNRRDEITGALIYDEKWFAQSIEGSERAVSRTFERILRDQRHSDVSLVAMRPGPVRRFTDCPMTAIAKSDKNVALFRHYGEGERFDPQLMSTERLSDLVAAAADRMREANRAGRNSVGAA